MSDPRIKKLQAGLRVAILGLADLPGVVPDDDSEGTPIAQIKTAHEKDQRAMDARYRAAILAGYRGSQEDFVRDVVDKE